MQEVTVDHMYPHKYSRFGYWNPAHSAPGKYTPITPSLTSCKRTYPSLCRQDFNLEYVNPRFKEPRPAQGRRERIYVKRRGH